MDHPEFNRRDFNRLTMAALGGVVAGTMAGCGGDEQKPAGTGTTPGGTTSGTPPAKSGGDELAASKAEPHACHGLNACKNQGASGKNDCAGQGTCATKEWRHSCGSDHACKGQGGCGDNPTQNDCKGQGGCHVPLMDSAWTKARKHFEEKMEKAGKKVGTDPGKDTGKE